MKMNFVFHSNPRKEILRQLMNVPFGSVFTDHIFMMTWNEMQGWRDARIVPYGTLSVDPAMSTLHYGSAIFEGMKAYRTATGNIAVFRPLEHFQRFNTSADRMCMPTVDVDFVIEALCSLLRLDAAWVPSDQGTALYIRPTMVATEVTLNLKESSSYLFFIVLSPVASLYGGGFKPVSIMVTEEFTRAAPGGTGAVKAAGNYVGAMLAQKKAKELGFAQVLWLDPVGREFVEEVGGMNIFFVINGKLVTPALSGTILPGITRKSVLECGADLGYEVGVYKVSIDELIECIEDGSCTEIFGTGTAAVIAPVGKLGFQNKTYFINDGKVGPVAERIYNHLMQLYYGELVDDRNWLRLI